MTILLNSLCFNILGLGLHQKIEIHNIRLQVAITVLTEINKLNRTQGQTTV